MTGFFESFQQITGVLYAGLVVNVSLAVSAMPALLIALTSDVSRTWHLVVLLAPLVAPGIVASFTVFQSISSRSMGGVLRTFVGAWKQGFRKAMIVGATTTAVLFLLIVDAQFLWTTSIGAMAIPLIVMAIAMLIVVALHVLVAIAAEPEAKLRLAWKAALFLSVRRWYLSIISLVSVAMLATFAVSQPVFALGLGIAPVLYVVWANAIFALKPVLPEVQPALAPSF